MASARNAVGTALLSLTLVVPAADAAIVFHDNAGGTNHLYTINDDGTGRTPLVSGIPSATPQTSPAFTPDGAFVVFEEDFGGGGFHDIRSVPSGGGAASTLIADPAQIDGLPTVSGDGTKIAYQHTVGSNEYDIFIEDLSNPGTPDGFQGSFAGAAGTANDSDPDWSPTADMLAWQTNQAGTGDQIYVGAISGAPAAVQLTNTDPVGNPQGLNYQAQWSPDGTKIAFVSNRTGNQDIYVMNADGSSQTSITQTVSEDVHPAWSRDGSTIAFASNAGGDYDIYTVPSDGSAAPVLLFDDAADQGGLDWYQEPPAPDPTVSIADASATEGSALAFEVTLSVPAQQNTTVDFVPAGVTASTDDFAGIPGTIAFAPGEQVKSITVATAGDSVDEADETITVALSNPSGAILGDAAATGTIADDDPAAPQPDPGVQTTPAPTPVPSPQPVENRTLVVETSRGVVLVKLPGSDEFVDLSKVSEIPNGTLVDTRKGRVTLRAARGSETDKAWFYDGLFKVRQSGGITDLTLQGPLGRCPKAGKAGVAARKKRKVRRLWGDGKGRFRTSGRFSSATVRGTWWLTEDSCAGTLTRVRKGSVTVRDRVRGRTVVVREGKHYLARAGRK